MATVDVIVPCYNYGRFLRECVDSVLSQEGVDVRVLIIDDCSTDDSAEVGRALAAEDARIEFRRHEKNRGHIATYNEGLDWIERDYCLLLSADDLLTQGALRRATYIMESFPNIGMTYGSVIRTEIPRYAAHMAPSSFDYEVVPGPTFIENCCRKCSNQVETVTAVVRTSIQKLSGKYRTELPHAGDLEMWLRCASLSSIGHINAPQGFYRRHASNMSNQFIHRRDHDQVKAAFNCFFDEFGSQVPDNTKLFHLARQGLAVQAFYLANDAFNSGDGRLCQQLAVEAIALWPGIRSQGGWKRLRWKRLVGACLWAKLRAFLG